MNRLTVKNESGAWDVPIRTSDDVAAFIPSQEIIDRLAAYEDTGLEPEEVRSMKWIPVTERLPEECEDLDLHEDMMIRFTSVWCCDANTGTINVRNRFQHKITGIQFLDQNIQDTDWHWSNSWWEPTHWMPIAPLPEPSKEETK